MAYRLSLNDVSSSPAVINPAWFEGMLTQLTTILAKLKGPSYATKAVYAAISKGLAFAGPIALVAQASYTKTNDSALAMLLAEYGNTTTRLQSYMTQAKGQATITAPLLKNDLSHLVFIVASLYTALKDVDRPGWFSAFGAAAEEAGKTFYDALQELLKAAGTVVKLGLMAVLGYVVYRIVRASPKARSA